MDLEHFQTTTKLTFLAANMNNISIMNFLSSIQQGWTKAVILLLILLSSNLFAQKQVLDNKLDLYFTVGRLNTSGPTTLTSGNVQSPSLFSNFAKARASQISAFYQLLPFSSLGVMAQKSKFSDWRAPGELSTYQYSSAKSWSVMPAVQFNTPFTDTGLFNRLELFVRVFGSISSMSTHFPKPSFGIDGDRAEITSRVTSLGYGVSPGLSVCVAGDLGFWMAYQLTHQSLNSKLYLDTALANRQLSCGLTLKLLTKKNF